MHSKAGNFFFLEYSVASFTIFEHVNRSISLKCKHMEDILEIQVVEYGTFCALLEGLLST